MISHDVRNYLFELFPELIVYDAPVSDQAIAGLGCIYDEGINWVIVYDEDRVIDRLTEQFESNGSEDSSVDALEWYHFNVLGGYVGNSTPVFMLDYGNNDCSATRFNTFYENYFTLDQIKNMCEAYDTIEENPNTFLFVPFSQIDQIKEYI